MNQYELQCGKENDDEIHCITVLGIFFQLQRRQSFYGLLFFASWASFTSSVCLRLRPPSLSFTHSHSLLVRVCVCECVLSSRTDTVIAGRVRCRYRDGRV
jgi:hypothetical protein